jgi:hypothetical protein
MRRRGPEQASYGSGLFDGSWAPTWSSVQGLASSASSFLSGGSSTLLSSGTERGGAQPQSRSRSTDTQDKSRKSAPTLWGPTPPTKMRGDAIDVAAAGSLAKRESALKAAKMASVLESHDGVNGGLDVSGKYKRRTSDDLTRQGGERRQDDEEALVYIHRVEPSDTYAGVVLRYKCREDVFRKANGLWMRDNVQTRKWLTIPVDACEIKSRPCAAPPNPPRIGRRQELDPLGPTPEADIAPSHDEYFGSPANGSWAPVELAKDEDPELPWTHIKWVSIESFDQPIELGRMPRNTLGYFPPRRKRSIHTVSSLSTPRQSLDLTGATPESFGSSILERAGTSSPLRHSLLTSRGPSQNPGYASSQSSARSRSRVPSVGSADPRPAWMRRPGGVGSLGNNVRVPGPEKDSLTSWTKKHLPALTIDDLPSMSIMGSETANFGFGQAQSSIAESPFEESRNVGETLRQGSGLDRAAAAVETWLRGALAKRPDTPQAGQLGRRHDEGDLIELANTLSDEGGSTQRNTGSGAEAISGMLNSVTLGAGKSGKGKKTD